MIETVLGMQVVGIIVTILLYFKLRKDIYRPPDRLANGFIPNPGKILNTPNGTFAVEDKPKGRKAIYVDDVKDDDT